MSERQEVGNAYPYISGHLVFHHPKIDGHLCLLSRDHSSALISPDQSRLSFG